MTSIELSDIEERIARDASKFELRPLLELILSLGYDREDVLFESRNDGRSSGPVRAVEFRRQPMRSVLICVSFGLWGDNSLLPSYVQHIAERSSDPNRLYDFIRYFDHYLIENLIGHLHPEWGGTYRSWQGVLRSFFTMANPASPSTLHWVAQLYFPELQVSVQRRSVRASSNQHTVRTGQSRLDGEGILGRTYIAAIPGLELVLTADEEEDLSGRQWSDIVLERLRDQLLPLLGPFTLPLVVRLVVLAHASWAKVDEPGAAIDEQGYLGYDRLRGPGAVRHATIMYRGITGVHVGEHARTAGVDVSL